MSKAPMNWLRKFSPTHRRQAALCVAGMAAALTLGGCAKPLPQHDTTNIYPQVHVTDWRYWGRLKVAEPIASRVGSGQLRIALPVHNLTSHVLMVDYRYRFLDRVGEQVQPKSAWMPMRISPHSRAQIAFTSMGARADDFSVNIRPAK